MQVRHVSIQRFRGIKNLDWKVDKGLICFVGPGDSTKSTILSAVDYALSPRWKLDFSDSDFFNGNTDEPVVITVTVGELSETFKSDEKFGLELRGWTGSELHDEPQDGDELVLSVRFSVDKSLEPKWAIFNDRRDEPRSISATDREAFGIVRIGDLLDRHLTWSRGSVLARLTGKANELSPLLAEASRLARSAISSEKLPTFEAVTKQLTEISKAVGVQPQTAFQPQLDFRAIDLNEGALSLHDGPVPLRLSGLGTRRLLTLALQKNAILKSGAIALIDEVEHGLEPHRLRKLLRTLRKELDNSQAGPLGQLFITTHSSVAVHELPIENIRVVRCENGETKVRSLDLPSQATIRRFPEVLLSSGIVVCEGETEVGLWKALDACWIDKDSTYTPFAVKGIAVIDGQGAAAESTAQKVLQAGYSTLLFADSDRALNPGQASLTAAGIRVVVWDGSMSTEQRIAADLPLAGFQELLALAVGYEGEDKVRSAVCGLFTGDKTLLLGPVLNWPDTTELRDAFGIAAKAKKWFKTMDRGERLGVVVTKYLADVPESALAKQLVAVRAWVDRHE